MNRIYHTILLLHILLLPLLCHAQSLLNKQVTIDIKKKRITEALTIIGRQGNFYFSYNSNIIKRDTVVSLSVQNKTVRQVLDILLEGGYEYTEAKNHIVIETGNPQSWYATGYVIDATTGENIPYASVYERRQFVSTLTNEQGYFKLKLKDRQAIANLYISKSWYKDTSISCRSNYTSDLTIGLSTQNFELDSFVVTQRSGVERNWFGRLFLSSRQRMQSINLSKYFVNKPYQSSIIPGVSTQGKLSTQVVNKFSFNVLGGYTAGVNGFELGGIFNIVKHDVRYAEVAGVFNLTGGFVNGVQVAGVHNNVLDSVNGWQFSGVSNFVNNHVSGLQITGIYNHAAGRLRGIQVSGIANFTKNGVKGAQITGIMNYNNRELVGTQVSGIANHNNKNVDGVQVAGISNSTIGTVDGVQVAGFANHATKNVDGVQVGPVSNTCIGVLKGVQISALSNFAKDMRGVQVGLINIADTSSGASIGLINFIWKGYHKISISTNEVLNTNFAIKSGNKQFYNILIASLNAGAGQEAYSFGYGLGNEMSISKRFAINTEVSGQYIFLGDWVPENWLLRGQLNLSFKLHKYVSLFAGPAYNFYYTNQQTIGSEYHKRVADNGVFGTQKKNEWFQWIGWSTGITIF